MAEVMAVAQENERRPDPYRPLLNKLILSFHHLADKQDKAIIWNLILLFQFW